MIIEKFSAQHNKNQSHNKDVIPDIAPAASLPQTLKEGKLQQVETLFEKQTQASHDLGELLRLKTKQIDKYGHVLDSKSNLYCRQQMIRSFLWMKLNKEKDNSGLNQQGLARILAQSFNSQPYTGQKIIQWGRSWVKSCTIPGTKAGLNKHTLS